MCFLVSMLEPDKGGHLFASSVDRGFTFVDLGSPEAVARAVGASRGEGITLNNKRLTVEPSKKPVWPSGLKAIADHKGAPGPAKGPPCVKGKGGVNVPLFALLLSLFFSSLSFFFFFSLSLFLMLCLFLLLCLLCFSSLFFFQSCAAVSHNSPPRATVHTQTALWVCSHYYIRVRILIGRKVDFSENHANIVVFCGERAPPNLRNAIHLPLRSARSTTYPNRRSRNFPYPPRIVPPERIGPKPSNRRSYGRQETLACDGGPPIHKEVLRAPRQEPRDRFPVLPGLPMLCAS
jgi:hypothetical protein